MSLHAQSLTQYINAGDTNAALNLIETGLVNLDERDENGQTFLMMAAQAGMAEVCLQLLKHRDVDVNAVDNDNWSALLNASKHGYLPIVEKLISRNANIEHRDMGGWTALMWACYKNRKDVCEFLLNTGANPDVKGEHHVSCLTWSAGRGYADIVELLLNKGAQVNTADKFGSTPLIWAARKGHARIVEMLVSNGAYVDNAGMNSWTAIIAAARGGFTESVEILLEYNPNINSVDKDGFSALALASKEGYVNIVRKLLQHGAYVNSPDRYGDTTLIHAVKGGHLPVVQALLKKCADVDAQGVDEKTALYCAVEKGHNSCAKLLLSFKADPNISKKDGDTPLLKAVRCHNSEMVRMLMDRGARVSSSDKKGDTALHVAVRSSSKNILEHLLRNPKDNRLLYKPNRQNETPYQIDSSHDRSVLTQIFGARNLNDSESIQGYDVYSSTIADVLSSPTLQTPITVGFYAKWGSGKSILLDKLSKDMRSFTKHSLEPLYEPSWQQALVLALFCSLIGIILGIRLSWQIGLSVGLTIFFLTVMFLGLVWQGGSVRDWRYISQVGTYLARQLRYLNILLRLLLSNEPKRTDNEPSAVRFLFTDNARLASVVGEKSISTMICTLCEALEAEYGLLASRLYKIFKPNPANEYGRFKTLCCIPYFLIVLGILLCVITSAILLAKFEIHTLAERDYIVVNSIQIAFAIIFTIAIVTNTYTICRVIRAIAVPPKKRVQKIGARLSELGSEGFIQALKKEVELMAQMSRCMDTFMLTATRLVVIVDGLDSCEQGRLLQLLDTVHTLFSDPDSPFILVLAIDPHVVIKGIEHNLEGLFRDSAINGHDYLRNIVQLPFFLQGPMLVPPVSSNAGGSRHAKSRRNSAGSDSTVNHVSSGKIKPVSSQVSLAESISRTRVKRSTFSSSSGTHLIRQHSTYDLNKSLSKNSYFSDINPKNMRRLMNIIAVTARLLRAFNIEFNWYRLASWINITEQWPYRLSWIILEVEMNEDLDDNTNLKVVYDRVLEKIPSSKDIDPLLEIDRNPQKLETFLSKDTSPLNVGDLHRFLPCTINVDPYLRKCIKDLIQSVENYEMGYPIGMNPSVQIPVPLNAPMGVPSGSASAIRHATPSAVEPQLVPNWSLRKVGQNLPQNSRTTPTRMPSRMGVSLSGANVYPSHLMQNQMPYMMAPHLQPQVRSPLESSSVSPPTQTLSRVRLKVPVGDINLTSLSVSETFSLLTKLDGITESKLSIYKKSLEENNINGLVLSNCSMTELRDVLKMSFGDWELFKALVNNLRARESDSSTHDLFETLSPGLNFNEGIHAPSENIQTPKPVYAESSPDDKIAQFPCSPGAETSASTLHNESNVSYPASKLPLKSLREYIKQLPKEQQAAMLNAPQSSSSKLDSFVAEFLYENQLIRNTMEELGIDDVSGDEDVCNIVDYVADDTTATKKFTVQPVNSPPSGTSLNTNSNQGVCNASGTTSQTDEDIENLNERTVMSLAEFKEMKYHKSKSRYIAKSQKSQEEMVELLPQSVRSQSATAAVVGSKTSPGIPLLSTNASSLSLGDAPNDSHPQHQDFGSPDSAFYPITPSESRTQSKEQLFNLSHASSSLSMGPAGCTSRVQSEKVPPASLGPGSERC